MIIGLYVPYTYRVYCVPVGKYYYGVRYAKACQPSEFWISYFTSSKIVHQLIREYGVDSFIIEIRRTFTTQSAAIQWEHRVNQWTVRWENYLNKCSFPAFDLTTEERNIAGKKGGAVTTKNKSGIHARSKEEMAEHGKRMHREKKGIHSFTKEERIKISKKAGHAGGKKGGIAARDAGVGIHALSHEERVLISRKSNKTNKQNNTGIYGISHEQRIQTGIKCRDEKLGFHGMSSEEKKAVGKSIAERKLGVHGRTPAEMITHGKKGGNSALTQKKGFHSVAGRSKQAVVAKLPWWNNGIIDMKSANSPGDEWEPGRITNKGTTWWNNGIQSKMFKTPPDTTWMKGRIKWKKVK